MKRKQPETFWMVRGPAGLAPYYGTTRTKIEMRARLERDGCADRLGFSIERVTVTPCKEANGSSPDDCRQDHA